MIFDLDALSDLDFDGHRIVFNAAFAAHDLPIEWGVERYRQLLALPSERQRVAAELRKRGVGTECDVLMELLVDEICTTKEMMFEEMILDAGLAPKPGLVDLVMDLYGADILVGVVSEGRRCWAGPLVRQLVGEGLVETVVTADDVNTPRSEAELYRHTLEELGVAPHHALAVTGSALGLRAANAAGLATVLIDSDRTAGPIGSAAAVRADYTGAGDALRLATCRQLHAQWWASGTHSAA